MCKCKKNKKAELQEEMADDVLTAYEEGYEDGVADAGSCGKKHHCFGRTLLFCAIIAVAAYLTKKD